MLSQAGTAEQCLVTGENGELPLHHAAAMGNEQLLSALLSRGYAEQQSLTADNEGRLPVHTALRRASHTGGATRVSSIKRCVGALVDAAGASQLGVRDSAGCLAMDYVLAALTEAEASARAELEKAEQENSTWVRELESNHKEALTALEEAHSAALAEAMRLATAEAADKVQEAEEKRREAEQRADAAEERTKEVEAASRQHLEELARHRDTAALATSHHTNGKGSAQRESVESLPLSPPRGPGSMNGSWDGPLAQQQMDLLHLQLPTQEDSAFFDEGRQPSELKNCNARQVGTVRYPSPSFQHDWSGGYRHVGSSGNSFRKAQAKAHEVAAVASRVDILVQELSAMLAAPTKIPAAG